MRCQWIPPHIDLAMLSDAELDRVYCGRPTVDRSCPWCSEHYRRVFKRDGMGEEAVAVEDEEGEAA